MSVTELQALQSIYRLGDNAYGLTILKALTEQCGREPSIGAVYAALERLEQKGLVESRLAEATPERGWRAKKYFTLTEVGKSAVFDKDIICVNQTTGESRTIKASTDPKFIYRGLADSYRKWMLAG